MVCFLFHSEFKGRLFKHSFYKTETDFWVCLCLKHMTWTAPARLPCVMGVYPLIPAGGLGVTSMCARRPVPINPGLDWIGEVHGHANDF